jgi:hypothetical protein
MSDEEIVELVRSQPRRMPSPALWERISADAAGRASRRSLRTTAAVVLAAAAAVGLAAAVLFVTVSKPVPPRPSRSAGMKHPANIAAAPVVGQSPTRSADERPTETAVKPPLAPADRANHRRVRTRPAKAVSPPRSVGRGATVSGAAPPVQQATPRLLPGAAAGDEAGSSYYIKVTRDGSASVLEGSAIQDDPSGTREIWIAYDGASPRANGEN